MANDERIKDYLLAVDTADWALVKFSSAAISLYGDPAEQAIADCRSYIKAYRRHVISTAIEALEVPVLSETGYLGVVGATAAIRTFAAKGDWRGALGSVDRVLSALPGASSSLPSHPPALASVLPGQGGSTPIKPPI